MTVFEIYYPGTWIELADRGVAFKVQVYLSTIESSLSDAAMAMHLFEQAQQREVKDSASRVNGLPQAQDESLDLRELAREYGTDGQTFLREWSRRALAARRNRWRGGELPPAYSSRLPFIYARSFLFSIWTIGRVLDDISKSEGLPPEATAAVREFASAFPALKALRDSSAHIDERVAGQARGVQIDLKPIENQVINAPGGGVLVVEGLIGNRFTGTTGEGELAEIEVGASTLTRVQECFQGLLNCLPWCGPGRLYPE